MNIYKCRKVKTPTRGTPESAGLDFYVPDDFETKHLNPGSSLNIPSGIHVKVPEGFALIFFNKSGVSLKKSLQVGATVVDEDYQGEVHLHVINIGRQSQYIGPGDKLVQGLLIPVNYTGIGEVSSLESLYDAPTLRGSGGFGSTGNK